MNTRLRHIVCLSIVIMTCSCELLDSGSEKLNKELKEKRSELENSRQIWLDFKKSNSNSYAYTVKKTSFVGLNSATTITVEKGLVTKRHFKYLTDDKEKFSKEFNIPTHELEWVEVGSKIGSHKNVAEPLTLDDIYEKSSEEWLIEDDKRTIYFETKNNGLISLSGYAYKNCADDCFIGVRISQIIGVI